MGSGEDSARRLTLEDVKIEDAKSYAEKAIALSGVAHDLVPGIRHDFGLVALDLLLQRGWDLIKR